MSKPRRVSILGSTGSVGTSTLDLMAKAEAAGSMTFEVEALTAGQNHHLALEQAKRWRPRFMALQTAPSQDIKDAFTRLGVELAHGEEAIISAALRPVDWIMAAIVGVAGLRPTWAAASTGAVIALANKESLVCCGPSLMVRAKAFGGDLIPVDSEHSAIFQVLQSDCRHRLDTLTLTASGGPFRKLSLDEMRHVTPAQAVAHPNWSMGAKISVDSATLQNKGLEMIEAAYLFDVPHEQIEIVVHPQSIIHSMVTYQDGSTLAQLGPPDMRTPIACALAWPDRLPWPAPRLDLAALSTLTFEAPDPERFLALKLTRQALMAGGMAPCVLNSANEIAVSAFLQNQIGFLDIASVVEEILNRMGGNAVLSGGFDSDPLERALRVDAAARCEARKIADALSLGR